MFERYFAPIIYSYVTKFIKGLPSEDLKVTLWGGEIVLKNLELRVEALNELSLPVSFRSGKIGELCITVPWRSLQTDPIKISVSGLRVELGPKTSTSTKTKSETVSTTESSPPPSPGGTSAQSQSWFTSIFNQIMANIQVTITDMSASYTISSGDDDNITAEITCNSANFYAVNANWEPSFVDPGPENIRRNECQLSGVTVRVYRTSPTDKGNDFVSNAQCKVRLQSFPSSANKCTHIDVYFEELTNTHLSSIQYHDILSIVKTLNSSESKKSVSTVSPVESLEAANAESTSAPSTPTKRSWTSWLWSSKSPPSTPSKVDEPRTFMKSIISVFAKKGDLTLYHNSSDATRIVFESLGIQIRNEQTSTGSISTAVLVGARTAVALEKKGLEWIPFLHPKSSDASAGAHVPGSLFDPLVVMSAPSNTVDDHDFVAAPDSIESDESLMDIWQRHFPFLALKLDSYKFMIGKEKISLPRLYVSVRPIVSHNSDKALSLLMKFVTPKDKRPSNITKHQQNDQSYPDAIRTCWNSNPPLLLDVSLQHPQLSISTSSDPKNQKLSLACNNIRIAHSTPSQFSSWEEAANLSLAITVRDIKLVLSSPSRTTQVGSISFLSLIVRSNTLKELPANAPATALINEVDLTLGNGRLTLSSSVLLMLYNVLKDRIPNASLGCVPQLPQLDFEFGDFKYHSSKHVRHNELSIHFTKISLSHQDEATNSTPLEVLSVGDDAIVSEFSFFMPHGDEATIVPTITTRLATGMRLALTPDLLHYFSVFKAIMDTLNLPKPTQKQKARSSRNLHKNVYNLCHTTAPIVAALQVSIDVGPTEVIIFPPDRSSLSAISISFSSLQAENSAAGPLWVASLDTLRVDSLQLPAYSISATGALRANIVAPFSINLNTSLSMTNTEKIVTMIVDILNICCKLNPQKASVLRKALLSVELLRSALAPTPSENADSTQITSCDTPSPVELSKNYTEYSMQLNFGLACLALELLSADESVELRTSLERVSAGLTNNPQMKTELQASVESIKASLRTSPSSVYFSLLDCSDGSSSKGIRVSLRFGPDLGGLTQIESNLLAECALINVELAPEVVMGLIQLQRELTFIENQKIGDISSTHVNSSSVRPFCNPPYSKRYLFHHQPSNPLFSLPTGLAVEFEGISLRFYDSVAKEGHLLCSFGPVTCVLENTTSSKAVFTASTRNILLKRVRDYQLNILDTCLLDITASLSAHESDSCSYSLLHTNVDFRGQDSIGKCVQISLNRDVVSSLSNLLNVFNQASFSKQSTKQYQTENTQPQILLRLLFTIREIKIKLLAPKQLDTADYSTVTAAVLSPNSTEVELLTLVLNNLLYQFETLSSAKNTCFSILSIKAFDSDAANVLDMHDTSLPVIKLESSRPLRALRHAASQIIVVSIESSRPIALMLNPRVLAGTSFLFSGLSQRTTTTSPGQPASSQETSNIKIVMSQILISLGSETIPRSIELCLNQVLVTTIQDPDLCPNGDSNPVSALDVTAVGFSINLNNKENDEKYIIIPNQQISATFGLSTPRLLKLSTPKPIRVKLFRDDLATIVQLSTQVANALAKPVYSTTQKASPNSITDHGWRSEVLNYTQNEGVLTHREMKFQITTVPSVTISMRWQYLSPRVVHELVVDDSIFAELSSKSQSAPKNSLRLILNRWDYVKQQFVKCVESCIQQSAAQNGGKWRVLVEELQPASEEWQVTIIPLSDTASTWNNIFTRHESNIESLARRLFGHIQVLALTHEQLTPSLLVEANINSIQVELWPGLNRPILATDMKISSAVVLNLGLAVNASISSLEQIIHGRSDVSIEYVSPEDLSLRSIISSTELNFTYANRLTPSSLSYALLHNYVDIYAAVRPITVSIDAESGMVVADAVNHLSTLHSHGDNRAVAACAMIVIRNRTDLAVNVSQVGFNETFNLPAFSSMGYCWRTASSQNTLLLAYSGCDANSSATISFANLMASFSESTKVVHRFIQRINEEETCMIITCKLKPGKRVVLIIESQHILRNATQNWNFECRWHPINSPSTQKSYTLRSGKCMSFVRPIAHYPSKRGDKASRSPLNVSLVALGSDDKAVDVCIDDGSTPPKPAPDVFCNAKQLQVVTRSCTLISAWTSVKTLNTELSGQVDIPLCDAIVLDTMRLYNHSSYPLEYAFQSTVDGDNRHGALTTISPAGCVMPHTSTALTIPSNISTNYVQLLVRVSTTQPQASNGNFYFRNVATDWGMPPLLLSRDRPTPATRSSTYVRGEGDFYQLPLMISTSPCDLAEIISQDTTDRSATQLCIQRIDVAASYELTNETDDELFIVSGETDISAYHPAALRHSAGIAWLPPRTSRLFYWKFASNESISIGILPRGRTGSEVEASPVWSVPFNISANTAKEIVFRLKQGLYARYVVDVRRVESTSHNLSSPITQLVLKPRFVIVNRSSLPVRFATTTPKEDQITTVESSQSLSVSQWPLKNSSTLSSTIFLSFGSNPASEWIEVDIGRTIYREQFYSPLPASHTSGSDVYGPIRQIVCLSVMEVNGVWTAVLFDELAPQLVLINSTPIPFVFGMEGTRQSLSLPPKSSSPFNWIKSSDNNKQGDSVFSDQSTRSKLFICVSEPGKKHPHMVFEPTAGFTFSLGTVVIGDSTSSLQASCELVGSTMVVYISLSSTLRLPSLKRKPILNASVQIDQITLLIADEIPRSETTQQNALKASPLPALALPLKAVLFVFTVDGLVLSFSRRSSPRTHRFFVHSDSTSVVLTAMAFQLDAVSPGSSCPVVLCLKELEGGKPSLHASAIIAQRHGAGQVPSMDMNAAFPALHRLSVSLYNELYAAVDTELVNHVKRNLALYSGIQKVFRKKSAAVMDSLIVQEQYYWPQLAEAIDSIIRRPMYIRSLFVSVPRVRASAQLKLVDGSLFLSFSNVVLNFAKDIDAINLSVFPERLLHAIVAHYIDQAVRQAPSLLGGLDILGNPTQLVRNVGAGLRDFLIMPISMAASRGPLGLIQGVIKGSGSLVGHVTGGVLQSVSGVSQSIARLIDPEKQGLLNVTSVVTQPIAEAKKSGIVGLATGFTKGLFRTITAPIGDALDLVSSASSAWSGGLLRAASSSIEIAPRTVHRAPLPVRYCDLKYSWKLITPTGAKIENVIARAECVVIGQSAESPGLLLVTHTGHICVVINDDYVVRSSVVSFETQRMADKGLLSNEFIKLHVGASTEFHVRVHPGVLTLVKQTLKELSPTTKVHL